MIDMNKIYTKEYIEYLLEVGFVKYYEIDGNADLEVDIDDLHWVQNIEASAGEEDGNLASEFVQIINIDKLSQDNIKGLENSEYRNTPDLSGGSNFQVARSFISEPDYIEAYGVLSFDFLSNASASRYLNDASLFSAHIDFTPHQAVYNGLDLTSKVYLTQISIDETENLAPKASYDYFSTFTGVSVSGNLLVDNGFGEDSDIDGGSLSVVSGTFTTSSGNSVTVSSTGDFVYSPLIGYTGADNFSYVLVDDAGAQDTARVDLHVSTAELVTRINFLDAVFSDYGVSHNFSDVYSVADNGATLHLADNTWKDIALDYTVTENTVIEFDYFSTKEGEIQGLGFDTDDSISSGSTFKLFGTQGWGRNAYETYDGNEGSWVHYKIAVGVAYRGDFDRLFFVNDDDNYVGANGSFSNIIIYEPGTDGADTMTGHTGSQTLMGHGGDDLIYGLDGNDVLYGGSGIDFLFGGRGSDTFVFDDINDIDHVQDFDLSEGDVLDISALLSGYDPITDAIEDFVILTSDGNDTFIHVDSDGNADSFTQVATLHGVTDLGGVETLEDNGVIVSI